MAKDKREGDDTGGKGGGGRRQLSKAIDAVQSIQSMDVHYSTAKDKAEWAGESEETRRRPAKEKPGEGETQLETYWREIKTHSPHFTIHSRML